MHRKDSCVISYKKELNVKIYFGCSFMKRITRRLWPLLVTLSTVSTLKAQEYPNPNWQYVDKPEQAGWNTQKLDTLKKYIIDRTSLTGMMIVHKGKVVFEYGDVVENSYIASIRKSILAILYGRYVKSGEIDLHKSLKEMSIDDVGGLLPIEKDATVKDIISARSGVFHPAGYPGDFLAFAPKRGSVKPGEYWLYSNWDFDAAGYIFEKETHKNIYDEVERVLAIPLHMNDWKRSLQQKEGDSTKSIFPAYPMWFSTRDMARIGLLMLNKGKWGDTQIIDEKWIEEILKPRTLYSEVNKHIPYFLNSSYSFGYGYMWWLWQDVRDPKFEGAYLAFGYGGQAIAVFPAVDVVIAYKNKPDYERRTSLEPSLRVFALSLQSLEKK
jgi:CubicO group peptidase (beta-lactamase class C family)